MRSPRISVLVVVLVLASVSFGQTADNLREKYGRPDEKGRYTIRPGVSLEPEIGPDGHAVSMAIKPFDADAVETGSVRKFRSHPKTISNDIALEILEELVPANTRGKETASFVEWRGCSTITSKEYEHVAISIVNRCQAAGGGTYSIRIQWGGDISASRPR